jgi:hypothetical protein
VLIKSRNAIQVVTEGSFYMTIDAIVQQILEELEPIVSAWKKNHPVDATFVPDSARNCLYQDVYNIGYVVFTADNLGQKLEIRTLAETLATLAKGKNHPDHEEMESRLAEKITKSVKNGDRLDPTLPKSIQLARAFDKRNNTKRGKIIEGLFDQLLDSFVLRDGNVTSEELALVKRYEELWKKDHR